MIDECAGTLPAHNRTHILLFKLQEVTTIVRQQEIVLTTTNRCRTSPKKVTATCTPMRSLNERAMLTDVEEIATNSIVVGRGWRLVDHGRAIVQSIPVSSVGHLTMCDRC